MNSKYEVFLPLFLSYCKIINVYDQKYESGAAFWPDVHRRLIIGLVIAQLLLLGLLSTKDAEELSPLLIALPVLTVWFHIFCKGRFESAFVKFPLQVCSTVMFIEIYHSLENTMILSPDIVCLECNGEGYSGAGHRPESKLESIYEGYIYTSSI